MNLAEQFTSHRFTRRQFLQLILLILATWRTNQNSSPSLFVQASQADSASPDQSSNDVYSSLATTTEPFRDVTVANPAYELSVLRDWLDIKNLPTNASQLPSFLLNQAISISKRATQQGLPGPFQVQINKPDGNLYNYSLALTPHTPDQLGGEFIEPTILQRKEKLPPPRWKNGKHEVMSKFSTDKDIEVILLDGFGTGVNIAEVIKDPVLRASFFTWVNQLFEGSSATKKRLVLYLSNSSQIESGLITPISTGPRTIPIHRDGMTEIKYYQDDPSTINSSTIFLNLPVNLLSSQRQGIPFSAVLASTAVNESTGMLPGEEAIRHPRQPDFYQLPYRELASSLYDMLVQLEWLSGSSSRFCNKQSQPALNFLANLTRSCTILS